MGFIGINDEATMKGIRDCCTAHVFIKDLRLGSNNKEGKKSGGSPRILRQRKKAQARYCLKNTLFAKGGKTLEY